MLGGSVSRALEWTVDGRIGGMVLEENNCQKRCKVDWNFKPQIEISQELLCRLSKLRALHQTWMTAKQRVVLEKNNYDEQKIKIQVTKSWFFAIKVRKYEIQLHQRFQMLRAFD